MGASTLRRTLTMDARAVISAEEKDRKMIHEWNEKKYSIKNPVLHKSYRGFLVYTFNVGTIISFIKNFNFMVLIQMSLAVVSVYLFRRFDITCNIHVALFVSPIVFPLAFSINTDFQRREKVLDDLASFKSAAMVWFFCMRDWKEAAQMDDQWLKACHYKLKSLLLYLREYLLTKRGNTKRAALLRAIYEDFSDTNQLIEKVRASNLPSNTALMSRVIHLLNVMCLSFERLRNVREYRSPRSIRSFNKVLIFFLPFILAPYFVFLGKDIDNHWSAYYIAVLVSFTFGALQGVQDKLDDPFDGMSEDDINLKTIDEWTFNSLEVTVNRDFKVGRFQVTPKSLAMPDEKNEYSPKITLAKSRKILGHETFISKTFHRSFRRHGFQKATENALLSKKRHFKRRRKSSFKNINYSQESNSPVQLLQVLKPTLCEYRCPDLLGNIEEDADIVKKSQLVNKILSTSYRESPSTTVEVSATPKRPSETKIGMENIAGVALSI